MLFRKIQDVIETYLKSGSNKVLIIDGARQIGKTFIIRHVGKALFPNYIEVNMLEDAIGERLFEHVKSVDDFYLRLSTLAGNKMKAYVLSNERAISHKGKITYIPIYAMMISGW